MYINRGPFKFNLKNKFSKVFAKNLFQGSESLSGAGSDLVQTGAISRRLPELMQQLEIRNFLDVPCGDFNWMSKIKFSNVHYTGSDVVPEIIKKLSKEHSGNFRKFKELNIVREVPDSYDAIFCRDLFVHLSNKEILNAIDNFRKSGSRYLITTTFTEVTKNSNLPIVTRSVGWRPINLNLKPFNFPTPITLINEECTEYNGKFSDKSLGVWDLTHLHLR